MVNRLVSGGRWAAGKGWWAMAFKIDKRMVWTVAGTAVVCSLVRVCIVPDDSDAGWFKRSNMAVLTDHRTGLQYLSAGSGGITPRLGPDGRQLHDAEGK